MRFTLRRNIVHFRAHQRSGLGNKYYTEVTHGEMAHGCSSGSLINKSMMKPGGK